MPENYSPKVLDHYRNPRNFGKLKKPTHSASALNPLCGDEITVYIHVQGSIIKEIKYEARGCALLIAAASVLAERLPNLELRIENLKKEDIEKMLDVKVDKAREGCATLVLQTIKKSLSF